MTMKYLSKEEFVTKALEFISENQSSFIGVDENGEFNSYQEEYTAQQNSVVFFEPLQLDEDDPKGDLETQGFECYIEKMDQLDNSIL